MHLGFHVSILTKSNGYKTSIVPLEGLGIKDNLSYEDVQVANLDQQVKRLRCNEVPSVKVFWRDQLVEGATWDVEEDTILLLSHPFFAQMKGFPIYLT